MKKSSLVLIAAISMLGSVAAQADDTGKTTGGTTTGGSTGVITAGGIAAGAVVAGAVVAANGADGNPITGTGTTTGTVAGN